VGKRFNCRRLAAAELERFNGEAQGRIEHQHAAERVNFAALPEAWWGQCARLRDGDGNFTELIAMVIGDFNVDLEQQPGATPFWKALDLKMWQANQFEVDKMNGEARHREPELGEVYKKAWAATPNVKILQASEMRKDCAAEALETKGWCPNEDKGRGGAKRVHTDASYAELRALLGIQDS